MPETVSNNYKTNNMTNIGCKTIFKAKNLLLVVLSLQISACTGQVKEKSVTDTIENQVSTQPPIKKQSTTFPQIHTNLNGMVREFVRTIHQDRKGHYWFGTNGDGIIRYDGRILEKITIAGISPYFRVLEIVEDTAGNIWFTAEGYGVYRYDGNNFKQFTTEDGLTSNVTQSIIEDNKGQVWFGSWQGLSIYDGKIIMNAKDKEPWTN